MRFEPTPRPALAEIPGSLIREVSEVGRYMQDVIPLWFGEPDTVTPAITRRFGFITSNSIRQVFCRRVVADALAGKPEIHLAYAIPDHPWTDGAGTAAVRIAMTVAEAGAGEGVLARVISEAPGSDGVPRVVFAEDTGRINADLTLGVDVNRRSHCGQMKALLQTA